MNMDPAKTKAAAHKALCDFEGGKANGNPALIRAALIDRLENTYIDWRAVGRDAGYCEELVEVTPLD